MQLKHQKELEKLAVKRQHDTVPVPCYTRTFPSTPPGSPQDRFPEMKVGLKSCNENTNKTMKVVDIEGFKKDAYDLGSMLAELRKGTMEMDV